MQIQLFGGGVGGWTRPVKRDDDDLINYEKIFMLCKFDKFFFQRPDWSIRVDMTANMEKIMQTTEMKTPQKNYHKFFDNLFFALFLSIFYIKFSISPSFFSRGDILARQNNTIK